MNTESQQSYVAEIRRLNDQFRTTFVSGAIVITPGIEAMTLGRRSALMSEIRNFAAFNADDDPYGEHDFGAIELTGETFFFKIDYYDFTMEAGSPDPYDPKRTRRVMTIIRADEY